MNIRSKAKENRKFGMMGGFLQTLKGHRTRNNPSTRVKKFKIIIQSVVKVEENWYFYNFIIYTTKKKQSSAQVSKY